MSRWIGSLFIAAASSVITLMLAWSSLGPGESQRTPHREAAEAGEGALESSATHSGDVTGEMLEQLALLEVPDEQDESANAIERTFNGAKGAKPVAVGKPRHFEHRAPPPMPTSPRARLEFCERCNEVAFDIDPSLARRLQLLREQDPVEFERNMKLFGRKLYAMAELKQRDPDLYAAKLNELRQELSVRQKAHDLREARAAGHKALSEELESALRAALGMQLALSIKTRLELVCRLEEQVKHIRADIEDQASRFNETVEQRFQSLVLVPATASTDPNAKAAADLAESARAADQ